MIISRPECHSGGVVLAGIGFFSLTAQSLFFRLLLTVFDGNELTVGIFLASWLFWLAVGALAVRPWICRNVPGFGIILLYLPAFFLQLWGMIYLRELIGLPYFAIMPVTVAVAGVWLINAPVAILSGAMFVIAADWVKRDWATAAGGAYVMDLIGSVAGALTVTLMLVSGCTETVVLLVCLVVVAVIVVWTVPNSVIRSFAVLLAVIFTVVLANGNGNDWQQQVDRCLWQQRLPGGNYQGSFSTAQARYWYGSYQGNWVISSSGGLVESLPDRESGLLAAAAALAQQPHPRRILLVGGNMVALITQLVKLPEVGEVVWLAPDPGYPSELLRHLPDELRPDMRKLLVPAVDVRTYLRDCRELFDLVWLRLEAPSNIAMNRYFSCDFFAGLRQSMAPDAVLGG